MRLQNVKPRTTFPLKKSLLPGVCGECGSDSSIHSMRAERRRLLIESQRIKEGILWLGWPLYLAEQLSRAFRMVPEIRVAVRFTIVPGFSFMLSLIQSKTTPTKEKE